jgi:hypothetical protein
MAKKLTPAEIAAFMKTLGLVDAPPTEAVGAPGSKPFVGDSKATASRRSNTSAYTAGVKKRVPVQNMNDLSSPAWWAKNIVAGGKSGVVDPVVKASKMDWLNPDSGLGPVERLNTLLGDALTVGSMAAPVKGATTAGMGLYDDLAARLADRYAYGIHISPTPNLKTIDSGSNVAKKLWNESETGTNYFFDTSKLNPKELKAINEYLMLYGRGEQASPSIYAIKTPKKFVKFDENYGTGVPEWIQENSKKIPIPTKTSDAKSVWELGNSTGYGQMPDGTSFFDYQQYPVNAFNTPKKLKVTDSIKLNSNYADGSPSGLMRSIYPQKWDEKQFVDFLNKTIDAQPVVESNNKFWTKEYLDSLLKNKMVKDLGGGKKSLEYEYDMGKTRTKIFNDEETLKKFLNLLENSKDNMPKRDMIKIFDIINNKGVG